MITYVPHHKIEKAKYDHCIKYARQSRIYAFSWYLDCVTDGWDALIEGDYEIVMPLPRKTKYRITYVYTPVWVQQLGLFSKDEISIKKENAFIKKVLKKFLWIDYQLNSSHRGDIVPLKLKRNYLLSLSPGIEQIQDNFNKNRKRILKKVDKNLVLDKEGDLEIFIKNYRNQDKAYSISNDAVDRLVCLCKTRKENIHVWNVFQDKNFMAGLIWLEGSSRITYLLPIANKKAKQLHIPTYLINELIKDFQGQNKVLDFEGSMIEGVEKFYKSFGAYTEPYYFIKKRLIKHV